MGANVAFEGPDGFLLTTRPTALKRMVGNLMDNAAAHGNRMKVLLSGEDGIRAHISVEDDGPGIPAELRADALLPFHRLGGESNRAGGKGAGLGLAFVQRTVEGQGGTIWLGTSTTLRGLAARITVVDSTMDGDQLSTHLAN